MTATLPSQPCIPSFRPNTSQSCPDARGMHSWQHDGRGQEDRSLRASPSPGTWAGNSTEVCWPQHIWGLSFSWGPSCALWDVGQPSQPLPARGQCITPTSQSEQPKMSPDVAKRPLRGHPQFRTPGANDGKFSMCWGQYWGRDSVKVKSCCQSSWPGLFTLGRLCGP